MHEYNNIIDQLPKMNLPIAHKNVLQWTSSITLHIINTHDQYQYKSYKCTNSIQNIMPSKA